MKLSSASGALLGAGQAASSPCAWQEERKEGKDSLHQQRVHALCTADCKPFASQEVGLRQTESRSHSQHPEESPKLCEHRLGSNWDSELQHRKSFRITWNCEAKLAFLLRRF